MRDVGWVGRVLSMEKANAKPAPDWEKIELDYRAGIKTLREIAADHGISHQAINKRAKRDGWSRDLSAKIRAKAEPVVLSRDDLDKAGFVYVIYLDDSANERFYKIGMSATFNSRFGAHQCASLFEVCVAIAYFTGNMRSEERELHALFSSKHIRGEWFRLTHDDLCMISKRSVLV